VKTVSQPSRVPTSQGSREGATENSLGDATMADLSKGFHKYPDSDEKPSGPGPSLPDAGPEGFLGRPRGYER
jgi:hypothetical protein